MIERPGARGVYHWYIQVYHRYIPGIYRCINWCRLYITKICLGERVNEGERPGLVI